MKNPKKLGQTIGALLVIVIATGIPSTLFRELSTTMARTPDFLDTVRKGATSVPFVVLLSFMASLAWLVIVALLVPHIKKINYPLALLFIGLWTISFSVSLYGDLGHLSLLSLGKEAENATTSVLKNYQALGFLKVKDYIWSHFITLVLYSSATALLFYYLFKTQLIPRFLSGWGLLAMGIVFVASWLNIFGIPTGEYPFMHNGLHLITLTGWLCIKGFKETAVT